MIFVDKMLYGKAHNWVIGQEQAWTTAGKFPFTVPDTGYYDVILIGGGGGGGSTKGGHGAGGGGSSGEIYQNVFLPSGDIVTLLVGTGGEGGRPENPNKNGREGGDTQFGNVLRVHGGEGGSYLGDGGAGYGRLGHDGEDARGTIGGAGGKGYLYNGVLYGTGGGGGRAGNQPTAGVPGGGGLVVVKLVAYA